MRCVLVLLAVTWVALPAVAVAQKRGKQTGRLEIEVSVAGADVAIDGVTVARSPLAKPLTLAVGTHALKVTKPGHAEFLDVVKVKKDQTTSVVVDLLPFAAAVSIDTTPSGADVTVDGKLVGVTPATLELDAGERVIHLTLEGYRTTDRTMKLTAGESYHLLVPLDALPRPPGVTRRAGRPLYARWWFWAATSAVVVGTTAIVIGASAGGDPLSGADRVITPDW